MKDTCKLALACAVMLALSSCDRAGEAPAKEDSGEMAWARAALERNPNLDVVAVDAEAGVFTVRDRRSGGVQIIKAADLAAVPVAQLSSVTARRALPAPSVPATVGDEEQAAGTSAMDDATTYADSSATAEQPDGEAATPDAGESLDYTVERRGDQVRVSGPGVSIVSAGSTATPTARGEAGQRTVDPFICEGEQMMRLNDRHIFVDGDAITARNGCELHITNSRIVASGTGIVVRDATVHITNSYIEGASGSYNAGPGAKLFLRGATFSGVMRRDAFSKIQELPGGEVR